MQNRAFTKVTVTPKAERSLRLGHPWVFADEVKNINGNYENGQAVDVISVKGRYLGMGLINDHSKIRVRIISTNANDTPGPAFFERRLRYAVQYRKTVMSDDFACCRLVFGEADGLPGLTVDRFENVLVIQSLCLGLDLIKPMLIETLVRILHESGEQIDIIYERSDVSTRENEGLAQYKGFIEHSGLQTDTNGRVVIEENGLKFNVDYINGQKTGYFLDQKYNRKATAKLTAGRRVLDCFTHTGSFALCAATAGAEKIQAVDVSKDAIAMAKENAEINNLQERVSFLSEDIFALLTKMTAGGAEKQFDFIILDPPAFTKNRATLKNALRGYKQLNYMAMKALPRGGYLATCSCSHFVTDDLFKQVLREAASEASVSLRQIEARQQSPDHPILWNVPETNYLKFYIFQVV